MNFFQDLRNSIYSPTFYRGIFSQTFGYSVSYYFKLAAVIALVSSVLFAIAVVPKINAGLWQMENSIMESFPDTLELRVAAGELQKNIKDEVIIPIPKGWTNDNKVMGDFQFEHLVVIDTASPATLEVYRAKKAFVLLAKDGLVGPDNSRGTIKILPYDEDMDFTLTEAKIAGFFNAVRPWYVMVAPVLVLSIFILFMFLLFFLLLPLAVVAFLAWVLLFLAQKIIGRRVRFGEAYRLTLHAVTLPLLISFFFAFIWDGMFGPSLFMATVLLVIFVNLVDFGLKSCDPSLPNS
ncbi:MAG: hypothetical protein QG665_138 [Patescibacteria group bacterium]|nr:hypothetical protein [Patescibacteria group bacterium]